MALASAFLQSLRHDLFLHARPRGSALSFEDITVLALLNSSGVGVGLQCAGCAPRA
jgi:hypothetical protein